MKSSRVLGWFIGVWCLFGMRGSASAGTLPWEQVSDTVATSIAGPLLAALALAATVLIGIIWAFSPSEGVRRAGPALFGLSIAGGAALLLPALWDITTSAGAELPIDELIIEATP